jgi:hypothetical protein
MMCLKMYAYGSDYKNTHEVASLFALEHVRYQAQDDNSVHM